MDNVEIQPGQLFSWILAIAIFIGGLHALLEYAGPILLKMYKHFLQGP